MTDAPSPVTDVLEKVSQNPGLVPLVGMTHATHIGENELPFVSLGDGTHIQLLHVDLIQGLWVIRTRFDPGYQVDKRYHTGPVFAVTYSGSWYYKEYPNDMNSKGSYLCEPAHSVHTLTVPAVNEGQTDVWFAIFGANAIKLGQLWKPYNILF